MPKEDWVFKEEERDAVCLGELCPKCLGKNISCIGSAPDGIDNNFSYRCQDCNEAWEGY